MDERTRAAYDAGAAEWIERRRPEWLDDGRLDAFAALLPARARVADLGCGPGWYAEALAARGHRPLALDVSASMLEALARRAPALPRVRADLFALPFARASLDGAWAVKCYQHLSLGELPTALARLHRALRPGAPVQLTLANLAASDATPAERASGAVEKRLASGELAGRLFLLLERADALAIVEGAGFEVRAHEAIGGRPGAPPFWHWLSLSRARTLADWIAPGLRLLVCGLNPSIFAADAGVPFARPGNRFWPAARSAGLLRIERDVEHALARGIGFSDVAKRATARADEVTPAEWSRGFARLEVLVRRFAPRAVCFVGLAAWRRVRDPRAEVGWIRGGFGGRPAYLMPSTSGLNARSRKDDLAAHLRRAASRRAR